MQRADERVALRCQRDEWCLRLRILIRLHAATLWQLLATRHRINAILDALVMHAQTTRRLQGDSQERQECKHADEDEAHWLFDYNLAVYEWQVLSLCGERRCGSHLFQRISCVVNPKPSVAPAYRVAVRVLRAGLAECGLGWDARR